MVVYLPSVVRDLPISAVAESSNGSSPSTSRIRFFSAPLEGGSVGGGGGRGTVPDGPGAESVVDLTRAGTGGSGVCSDDILKASFSLLRCVLLVRCVAPE